MVIPEQAAEALLALDRSIARLRVGWMLWEEKDVVFSLMGALVMVVLNVVADGMLERAFTVTSSSYEDAVGDSVSASLPTTLYIYDADGNLIKQVNPNGTETDTDYSSMWTATGVGGVFGTETVTNKMTGGNNLSQYVYQFDADRRKITDTESVYYKDNTASNGTVYSTTKITWTYDAMSHLMSETYDYGKDDATSGSTTHTTDDYAASYKHDLDGNRLILQRCCP